jgi:hypothetical protein
MLTAPVKFCIHSILTGEATCYRNEEERQMKILVGYDGSNSAKDALILAKNTLPLSMRKSSSFPR